ncbi:hypothetical protein EGR_03100 [Echinococcus granulosus]|uniref:Uncharacterized protein n=1 Tax=Echinococcus granulosus TaxID=6210 RepID=W6V6P9_ECHGR|nr:hypothetical protein EGR_03100 [Echinococcus granulosus]EUB62079.1 hypothetical protein EGR_03100 [Echinococcus granulosus]
MRGYLICPFTMFTSSDNGQNYNHRKRHVLFLLGQNSNQASCHLRLLIFLLISIVILMMALLITINIKRLVDIKSGHLNSKNGANFDSF